MMCRAPRARGYLGGQLPQQKNEDPNEAPLVPGPVRGAVHLLVQNADVMVASMTFRGAGLFCPLVTESGHATQTRW